MRALVIALFPIACAPFGDEASLAAQALSARVAAVRDGDAQLAFTARDGVCGDGRSMIVERVGGPGDMRIYSSSSMSYITGGDPRITDRCEPGPVSVVLRVRDREVAGITLRVGPVAAASGITNLGAVPAAEAAAYLLDLAERAGEKVSHDALLGAALADSARIAQRLTVIARNMSFRPSLREQALKHLTDAAYREGDRSARTVARAIALDDNDVLSVRERAVRVYAHDATTAELRALFGSVEESTLRERALRAAAAIGDKEAMDWMQMIAKDNGQPMGLRERAIRVLGEEMGRGDVLRALYPSLTEIALQERVIRSQADAGGADARRFLIAVAEDRGASRTLRDRALRSLGEQGDLTYLRQLYPKLDDRTLRDRVLRVMSEAGDATAFLRAVALDEAEDAGLRDRAVRLLAEQGLSSAELGSLYDKLQERAIRTRIIQLLAERGDDAAWNKLESISRGDADPDLRRRALRTLQRS